MSTPNNITKEQLIKIIANLENKPEDRIRILGDAGITVLGTGLGVASAGAIATAAGATSIFGVTTFAGWLGVTAVAATPVGWIIGCAAVAGGAAYGLSQLIRGGGLSEGRKLELLQKYKEEHRAMLSKERTGAVTEQDRISIIVSMRELIEKDQVTPEFALRLIEQVERGNISVSLAIEQLQELLAE